MFGQNSAGLSAASTHPRSMGLESLATESKREPELARVLQRQTSIISELESLCNTLEQRLGPIIRPATPTVSDGGKPEGILPSAVQAIDNNSDRLLSVNTFVSDLLNRIEV